MANIKPRVTPRYYYQEFWGDDLALFNSHIVAPPEGASLAKYPGTLRAAVLEPAREVGYVSRRDIRAYRVADGRGTRIYDAARLLLARQHGASALKSDSDGRLYALRDDGVVVAVLSPIVPQNQRTINWLLRHNYCLICLGDLCAELAPEELEKQLRCTVCGQTYKNIP